MAQSDEQFEERITACDRYAIARRELHAALSVARMEYVAASFALASRHAELSMMSVPQACSATTTVGSDWCVQRCVGDVAPSSLQSRHSREAEEAAFAGDPATWFCDSVPADVRRAQDAFAKVVQAAAACAREKQAALDCFAA